MSNIIETKVEDKFLVLERSVHGNYRAATYKSFVQFLTIGISRLSPNMKVTVINFESNKSVWFKGKAVNILQSLHDFIYPKKEDGVGYDYNKTATIKWTYSITQTITTTMELAEKLGVKWHPEYAEFIEAKRAYWASGASNYMYKGEMLNAEAVAIEVEKKDEQIKDDNS